jgi:hypothetical protein
MGLFSRLFGHGPPPSATVGAEMIVHAYKAVLSSRKSMISDVAELPYPKPRIKAALITAIKATKDAKIRVQLKAAFVALADWQEGVGPGPEAFETTLKRAQRVATRCPSFAELSAKVAAEGRALLDELKSLGL